MYIKGKCSVFTILALSACFGSAQMAWAAAPDVKYYCTGTFGSPAMTGQDIFQLAGRPFTVSIVVNTATVPSSYGTGWARYTKLTMSGTVQSKLFPTPIAISSTSTSIQLSIGPQADTFTLYAPIKVIGLNLSITSSIQLPVGTITQLLIHPFSAPARMTPAGATMVYSDGTDSTTLGMNGSLNAVYIASTTITSGLRNLTFDSLADAIPGRRRSVLPSIAL
ncbi:MAG: hypothetical protein U0Q18_07230 [Bryobacteraceae bacterium]